MPARMDRLPWTKFHWMVVIGLGAAWILDGLEAQIAASAGFQETLQMTATEVGFTASIYLAGQVIGALIFARLSDQLGRKKIFIATLGIYLFSGGMAGFSFSLWFLLIFRFISGLGIGGEHAAINAAIDEIIPPKYRGHASIAIYGTYWGGAALGATINSFLLDPSIIPTEIGWRIGFFLGPALGFIIIFLRRHLPESPRWLLSHGHVNEAEQVVNDIEVQIQGQGYNLSEVPKSKRIPIVPYKNLHPTELIKILLTKYPRQTLLSFSLMVAQSFFYNAIFFAYVLVLKNFYYIPLDSTQDFFLPFAIGNLAGPLILGPLFDTIGRRKMIFATYSTAGVVLASSAVLFYQGILSPTTQTLLWSISFFFASAGASSAYLTISEIFPLALRNQAISYFFAIAQITGAIAPAVFGILISQGIYRGSLTLGYLLAACVMIIAGIIGLFFGFDAEGKSLEDVSGSL
ncbi:major facilitator superfamily transporter [Candidatus Nitrosoglobus terrae]|uniref:Major facilitator superfamily transporter n=1 Tax=Candidatus Nitrosoglobus terrae TaxID=1630141 RepID=A0A1Q2SL31_9GAMM|nr:major facilitator superfamily transporter [Candidatus Nitrosoglobus terrae]